MAFDLGDTVPLSVEITDAAGSPTNAASVTLNITLRGGATISAAATNPSPGRYEFDFIPDVPGIYDVTWRSVGPAAAFDDVVDVRATGHRVISLSDARDYLNKVAGGQVDEDELRTMMAAAVERVDRHLFTRAERDGGRTLATEPAVPQSQVLAVKMVLAEFWRTQRNRLGGRSSGLGAAASSSGDVDAGLGGTAPLPVRLADLLGPAADGDGGGVPPPTGSFPPAQCWPDPAQLVGPRWGSW